ncbi:hypothetical protein Q7A53_05360 [Halobacillus rhizosphaerae]|uniref:hypothetical protein n=1 Tax=Halobacillus rhizosphaerae TaxID=3064889 RepID=UPI00398A5814
MVNQMIKSDMISMALLILMFGIVVSWAMFLLICKYLNNKIISKQSKEKDYIKINDRYIFDIDGHKIVVTQDEIDGKVTDLDKEFEKFEAKEPARICLKKDHYATYEGREIVTVRGGHGNAKLLSWDYGRAFIGEDGEIILNDSE